MQLAFATPLCDRLKKEDDAKCRSRRAKSWDRDVEVNVVHTLRVRKSCFVEYIRCPDTTLRKINSRAVLDCVGSCEISIDIVCRCPDIIGLYNDNAMSILGLHHD